MTVDERYDYLYHHYLNLSFDRTTYERQNYTLLQMIGDIGSLTSTLSLICEYLLKFIFQIGILLDNHILRGVFRKIN